MVVYETIAETFHEKSMKSFTWKWREDGRGKRKRERERSIDNPRLLFQPLHSVTSTKVYMISKY